ncbi:MAG: DUF4013 domain-containing protein [Anaerolineae bacterium]|jgi:hypothetical protein
MNFGEAIAFLFDDEEWPGKLLVGAVITLIPIFGGAAVTGYAIALLRNVEADRERPMPSWDRLGEYFVDGLLFWVATLIYSIPLLILICPLALVWVLPAFAGDNQDLTAVLASLAGIFSVGLGCLGLLYGLVLWVLTPVLQIRYAETGKLGACLDFGDVFRFLLDNAGSILIAQVLVWAASTATTLILGSVVGVFALIPICGWIIAGLLGLLMIPVGVWVMLFAAHLYGQIGRQAAGGASPT